MDRLDVTLATKYEQNGETKNRYQKVGAAFPMKNGSGGFSIKLDHAICVVPGVTELVLFAPKAKDEGVAF